MGAFGIFSRKIHGINEGTSQNLNYALIFIAFNALIRETCSISYSSTAYIRQDRNIEPFKNLNIGRISSDPYTNSNAGKTLFLIKPRGFCEGVSRAIRIVEECINVFGPPIYVNHEIVHNEAVCSRLREKGVIFMDELEAIPEKSVVVFSAHGVSPAVRELAKSRNLTEIDASCPLVNKVHVYTKKKAEEGYKIILIGHKNHVETIGTSGEAPDQTTIVETVEDVQNLEFPEGTKLFYVTQTTLSLDDCREIREALVKRYPQIQTIPSGSICYATTNRQSAIHKACEFCDLVLIVGSTTSSNANRLVEAALRRNVRSFLVSDASAVTEDMVGFSRNVALSSSASTPDDLTLGIVEKLKAHPFNFKVEEFEGYKERIPTWRLPRNLEAMIKCHNNGH